MDDDKVFWARLEEMPPWEAEQECVARREQLCLENAMLDAERNKLNPTGRPYETREYKALGVAMRENASRTTRLNERLKYLRKLQTRLEWKLAVQTLFGQEAYEQCAVWLEQQYKHLNDTRREWAAK
jgi:DNA gyrase/topoisomerase IV subunit B